MEKIYVIAKIETDGKFRLFSVFKDKEKAQKELKSRNTKPLCLKEIESLWVMFECEFTDNI